MSLRRVTAMVSTAFILVGLAVVSPVSAFAETFEQDNSTAVVVTAAEPGQISVSAPVSFPLALRGDGGVLEGSALEVRNLSTTPVAITNVRVEERNGVTVVPMQAESFEVDTLQAVFAPDKTEPLDAARCLGGGAAPPVEEAWTALPGEVLRVGLAGSFSNPSETFRSTYEHARPVAACVVVWTVESR